MAVKPWEDPDSLSSTYGRDHLEQEFFDTKIRGIILLDIVKYEDRAKMIDHFSRLLRAGKISENEIAKAMEGLPDLKNTGHIGGSAHIGTFVNLKKVRPDLGPVLGTIRTGDYLLPFNAHLDLPDPFIAVEIGLFQIVDFAYCVCYTCYVDESYQQVEKSAFVNSHDKVPHRFYYKDGSYSDGSRIRGPKYEPLTLQYEKEAAEFFREYSIGLFLSNFDPEDPRIPSIRVLSTPKIDFCQLDQWFDARSIFLSYLRMGRLYCRYKDAVITYQDENLYTNPPGPKGVTLLYSEADGDYKEGEGFTLEITSKAEFLSESLIEYLFPYYWILHNSRSVSQNWSAELSQLRRLSTDAISSEKTLHQRKQDLQSLLSFYGRFATFSNAEKISIRILVDRFNSWGKHHLAVTHRYNSRFYLDIFGDLATGINRLAQAEQTAITDIQQETFTLLEYYKDLSNIDLTFSNISLQTQIKWLTGIGTAVAAIVLIVQFLT